MKKEDMKSYLIIILALIILVTIGCRKKKDEPIALTNAFVHTNGTDIIDANGNKIYLRGVAFGNEVWSVDSNHKCTSWVF